MYMYIHLTLVKKLKCKLSPDRKSHGNSVQENKDKAKENTNII